MLEAWGDPVAWRFLPNNRIEMHYDDRGAEMALISNRLVRVSIRPEDCVTFISRADKDWPPKTKIPTSEDEPEELEGEPAGKRGFQFLPRSKAGGTADVLGGIMTILCVVLLIMAVILFVILRPTAQFPHPLRDLVRGPPTMLAFTVLLLILWLLGVAVTLYYYALAPLWDLPLPVITSAR